MSASSHELLPLTNFEQIFLADFSMFPSFLSITFFSRSDLLFPLLSSPITAIFCPENFRSRKLFEPNRENGLGAGLEPIFLDTLLRQLKTRAPRMTHLINRCSKKIFTAYFSFRKVKLPNFWETERCTNGSETQLQ